MLVICHYSLCERFPLFTLELLVGLVGEVAEHVVTDHEGAALTEPRLQLVRPTPVVLLIRHAVNVNLQVACSESINQLTNLSINQSINQ